MDELPERPTPARMDNLVRRRVHFVVEQEHFNRYTLSDGNTIKLKLVLTDVKRVEGVFAPGGVPVYEPQFTIAAAVEVD